MLKFRKSSRTEERPDFTSLTDIMFSLLLFFLLTAVSASGLKMIELSAAQGNPPLERIFSLGVFSQGIYEFEGQFYNLEDLIQVLQVVRPEERKKILIKADPKTTIGDLNEVLMLLNKLGFKDIAFSAEGEDL